ncbi:hypothetical protein DSO57_1011840 [Entomophthora muscae]|uniref:Uncharacterized protein n=2 Tax=Entomophthora muscae TaxID=34485 RepID=A0ACC2RKW1_9FUNG|nr:hypothetical protein DSO57_1011839 [Entomophthora muscae]KAJ9050723.1 hypothetical protein DSO57_1011840 [Entomophthora muscae]
MYYLSLVILLVSVFSKTLKEHCDANGIVAIKYLSIEPNYNTTEGAPNCSNGKCFPYSIYSSCVQESYFKYTPTADKPFNSRFLDEVMEEGSSMRGYNGIDFHATPETFGNISYYIKNSLQANHILNIPCSYYLAEKKAFDNLAYMYQWHHRIVVQINQTDVKKIKNYSWFYPMILLVAENHEVAKDLSEALAPKRIYVKEQEKLDLCLMKSFDIVSVYKD